MGINRSRIIKIDLGRSRCSSEDIPPRLTDSYLGGRGLGFALLREFLSPGLKPFDPGSPLVFCTGLLAGSSVPASGRLQISALSPATGILGSSNAGGFFAANLAAEGFRALVVTGRAQAPVMLWIEDGRAELRPAGELWGRDTWQTLEAIGESKRVQAAVIGPAGENRSALAGIMLGRHSAAGRTGLGAVMGSKNLKAVAVAAKASRPEAPPPAFRKVTEAWLRELRGNELFAKTSQEGQSGYLPWAHEMGILGTRNFQEVSYPEVEAFNSEAMLSHRDKRRGCARCPVNCKADFKIKGGRFDGLSGPRPEFESLCALGPRCGIADLEAVYDLSNRCARLGLDTISAGAGVAFAMDLFEQGIIDLEKTGGLSLEWGDSRAAGVLLEQMALHQGFGAVLSDGVARAAREIGGRALERAYTVKGLELSAYDPRTVMGAALGYAVAGRGADFGSFFSSPEYRWSAQKAEDELGRPEAADRFSGQGKAELIRRCLIVNAVLDSLGVCKVPSLAIMCDFSLKWEAEMLSALFSRRITPEELMRIGERIVNLERLINTGRGVDSSQDRLPEYFCRQPAPSGPAQGQRVDLESMQADFYRLMGWDESGQPEAGKLHELGLEPPAETDRRRSA